MPNPVLCVVGELRRKEGEEVLLSCYFACVEQARTALLRYAEIHGLASFHLTLISL